VLACLVGHLGNGAVAQSYPADVVLVDAAEAAQSREKHSYFCREKCLVDAVNIIIIFGIVVVVVIIFVDVLIADVIPFVRVKIIIIIVTILVIIIIIIIIIIIVVQV
jgi:hypothetical protein